MSDPGVHLGIGASSAASAAEVRALAEQVLLQAGRDWSAVASVATTCALAADARIRDLGRPVAAYDPSALAGVAGVETSARAAAETGTPSVAEAAALLAAGDGARLIVAKSRSAHATAALAGR